MTYHIITTQEKIYDSFLNTGLIARGLDKKFIDIKIHNLYDFGFGIHKSIDDTPYGGGAGMVIRVDVMDKAIKKIQNSNLPAGKAGLKSQNDNKKCKIILLTPQGNKFDQKMAKKLSKEKELILISGRFEGFDERIRDLVDLEISIGDYVLTSGDLPTMVLIDAISRQIPGFIEEKESLKYESFDNNLLEFPQYTRPFEYKNKKVPEILLSGNHAEIAKWRKQEAIERTRKRRPDINQ